MLEKLNNKINIEIEKHLKKEDLSLEDLKFLIEIKNSLEFQEKINKVDLSVGGFEPININQ